MKAMVKKFLRHTFPILLISLILALFSVSAFAEETDPGDTWWSLGMDTGILYVHEDVPECSHWLGYYSPWHEWREAITEIRISEGVEEIGSDGFADCPNLTKVTFPSTLKKIGDHAFAYCFKLTSVTLPAGVETVAYQCFGDCSELTEILVDEKNPYFASDDQGVLYTKDRKKLLLCPAGFTGKLVIPYGVTTLAEYAMNSCEKMTEIQIPNSVTRLERDAITYCTALTHVSLPDSVEFVETAVFSYCSNLKTLDLAKAEMADLEFEGCDSLERITVSKNSPYLACDSQGALYSKDMTTLLRCLRGFSGRFVIPKGVETIGYDAFQGCVDLTAVEIPKGVTNICFGAFSGCHSLKNLTIPNSVRHIEDSAFANCSALTDISLPKGLTELWSGVFENCISLKTVELPDTVTVIHYRTFSGCTALERISLPEQLTVIGYEAFSGCSSLKSIEFPQTLKEGGQIELEDHVFEDCVSLKTVELPDTLRVIPCDTFSGCTALERISLPEQLTVIGFGAFSDCSSLKNIELPQTLKEVEDDAFYSCISLKNLVLPYGLERIGNSAFADCEALQSLCIPDSVKELGWSILSGCKSLSFVIVPSCVTELDELGLGQCEALKAVYFRGPAPGSEYAYIPDGITLYYIEGQEGWTKPLWEGYNTKTWSGYWAKDVKKSNYFYEPVQWALEEGIAAGMGKDLFRPELTCTRAQVVTFLWRAKGCPEPTGTETPFKDISPKSYFYKAVLWAAEQGIAAGMTKDLFVPDGGCTRAQIVTFLWRAEGRPQTSNVQNPFEDVSDHTYYSRAVLWAVEQGITAGVSKDQFAPFDLCTRAQTVTFLWRGKDPVVNPYGPYYSVLQQAQGAEGTEPTRGRGLLYDLDGNGTEELILTYSSDGEHCAVYTIEDGKAVPMLEDHVIVVDGRCELGLAEIEGQQYLYTHARTFDMVDNDVYGKIAYETDLWKLYLPSEKGMDLATEVYAERYYTLCVCGLYEQIIEELCSSKINGEEKSIEDYWNWCDSRDLLASFDGEYGCGYPIEDLLTVCKP